MPKLQKKPRVPLTVALQKKFPAWHLPRYWRQRKEWLQKGGVIDKRYRILTDYTDTAGAARGHYYHQDLLVANLIHTASPRRHIDIGSRIDGFVAHVAAFREIEVFDIRKLDESRHTNIKFVQKDLMDPNDAALSDSVSCLHAIEHFGLGRYGDPIDPSGHLRGVENISKMVEPGGTLYISFPIGLADAVHFNAHRVFHPASILGWQGIQDVMALQRFDWVDAAGQINLDAAIDDAVGAVKYGCGIYTFKKIN
ncbi:MAG: DUF268 domain-containing protein [Granulosicoccus sp.]|nr:DUF268 domain-containing protein [Granulosicoccus sp.]